MTLRYAVSVRRPPLEPIDLARSVVDSISARMGADILLLDLAGLTHIADFFVIASAESDRQIGALSEGISADVKVQAQRDPLHVEGTPAGGWVLMDYGGVIVHLFSTEQRSFYHLEELWSKARTVVRIA